MCAFNTYYFCAVVFILAGFRLTEPMVLSTLKRQMVTCKRTCCFMRSDKTRNRSDEYESESQASSFYSRESEDNRKGIEDTDLLNDTLNAFLTSSLNVELVYTILKGIRRIVKTLDSKTRETTDLNFEAAINEVPVRLRLDSIKIRNFKLWENAH